MKELWTGDFVGRMHVEEVTQQELADEAGISKGYVCMILNNARNPKNGREMLENAFAAVLQRRRLGATPGANRTLLLENDGAYIRDGGQAVVSNGGQSVINFHPISGETSMNLPEKPTLFENGALPETHSLSG